MSTLDIAGKRIPIGGGGYFRLYPYWAFSAGIGFLNEKERMPAIFYLHPWEIDAAQPRVKGLSVRTRFRHYLNLHKTERRLGKLLRDFQWGRVVDVFDVDDSRPADQRAAAPAALCRAQVSVSRASLESRDASANSMRRDSRGAE